MNSIDFNKVDKMMDKLKVLGTLTDDERVSLLESQINTIYQSWNDSIEKVHNIMDNNTCINLDEKIIFYDLILSQALWTSKKIDYPKVEPEKVSQWRIFNCDLGYNIASEQNKKRPVILLNSNSTIGTLSSFIVAPIVGSGKKIYAPEVELLETAYSNVYGKIDLSQMRSVSKYRLDTKPIDRLMTDIEYKNKYGTKKYTMLQDVIKKKIKDIFGIAI